MKGEKPTDGTIEFNNGKITLGLNILYNGLYYQLNNGIISNGTKESVEIISEVLSKIQTSIQNYTGTCEIKNTTTMVCGNETITLSQSGHKAEEGIITFNNGEITSYKNLKMDGKYYHNNNGKKSETDEKQYLCTKVSDTDNSNIITPGDKYKCKVNDNDTFNFYILSIEGDKVNLIMDRNICNDGTVNYTSENNYCRYPWYSSARNNTYGPVTAMQELYAGTKDWDNVPAIELNYIDEENTDLEDIGYISLVISEGVATITGKPTTKVTTIGTTLQPLKSRLPKSREITGGGCTIGNGSCSVWLMENMKYWNGSNDKYSMNNNTETYQNILGYWLLSSYPNKNFGACFVYYYGSINYFAGATPSWTTNNNYGIRPVITVPISDLSN